MTAFMHQVLASEAREKLPALLDQAVEAGVPSVIARRGKERAVLASLDVLQRITRPYAVRVDYLPDDETGAWALWIPELRLHAEGDTLSEARRELVAVVRDYLDDYFAHWLEYQHVADRATEYLYALRLWLATDAAELAALLFAPPAS